MNQQEKNKTKRIMKWAAFLLTSVALTVLIIVNCVSAAAVLPVIPGAVGYGMETVAGRGGTVYKVTSLANTNTPGTLLYAINQKGPRTVIFEVSGTIEVNNGWDIENPYITIAGQTAPSPGIFLKGLSLNIATHDVLIQHIRIAPGDDPLSVNPVSSDNRDALAIAGNNVPYNIVVDHCTFTWSVDEAFSTWYPSGEVTFSNLLVSEPLNDSIHMDMDSNPPGVPAPHGFGPIFYYSPLSKITLIDSLISHCASRMPESGAGSLVMVNNVIYDKGDYGIQLYNRSGVYTKNSIVGNLLIDGPSVASWSKYRNPIIIMSDVTEKSKVYVYDNLWQNFSKRTNQWDLVSNDSGKNVKSEEPPVWNEGLVAKPVSTVKEYVMKNAGARPADRLPYETRIVNNLKNGTGKIINSIAEAGGWPVVAENYRALTVPENPDGDNDGDGYTNLEEWLHAYAADVEGSIVGIKDVKSTDWFYDNVKLLVSKGVVAGYPDMTFKPSGTVQVDAFIKMTVTALGYNNIQNSTGYWATNYINKAMELKLVSEGEFTSYTRAITRGEMARIIARALTDEQYPVNLNTYTVKITDYAKIKAELKEYVLKAFYKGIITGYTDGTFKDSLNATRAEAATMIARLIEPALRKTVS